MPRLIRLGSLPEMARELGFTGHNWSLLRRALHQNASAYITAKISYRAADRSERFLEAGFHRYSVIFTGEKLPSGAVANAVYLVLSDIFQDVLNSALWRPLDYDYMKSLPPGAQRFYEIVSYQIYAALRHGNPRAKFAYSEYCLLSTAMRYFAFDPLKKQMHKIIRPHLQSGYLAKVQYEAFVNAQGEADWMMYLTPGPHANREFRAFTGRGQMQRPQATAKVRASQHADDGPATTTTPALSAPVNEPSTPNELSAPNDLTMPNDLIALLVAADLNRGDAERLARAKPEECRRQLAFLPHVAAFTSSRGAYLRRAIEEGYGPPKAYAQQQTRAQAADAVWKRRGEDARRAAIETARQSHEQRHSAAFATFLGEWANGWETTQPEAFAAFGRYEEARLLALRSGPLAVGALTQKALETFDPGDVRADRIAEFCRGEGRLWNLQPLTFWEWDRAHNTQSFDPKFLDPKLLSPQPLEGLNSIQHREEGSVQAAQAEARPSPHK